MKIAYILILISVICSASQFPLLKGAVYNINPSLAAIGEVLITILFCFVLAGFKRKLHFNINLNIALLSCGIINALGVICLFKSISLIHPAMIGLISRLYFVYALIISNIYFKEKLSIIELTASFFIIFGSFQFAYNGFVIEKWNGIIFAIVYPFCFALQNAIIKKKLDHLSSYQKLFSIKIIALPFILAFIVFEKKQILSTVSFQNIGLLIISTFFATFISTIAFYSALKRLDFSIANLMRASEPIFVLLFSIPFFPIKFNIGHIFGGAMVIFGLISLPILNIIKKKNIMLLTEN
jgi:drug/metabolite transporter (DMT)-like permease